MCDFKKFFKSGGTIMENDNQSEEKLEGMALLLQKTFDDRNKTIAEYVSKGYKHISELSATINNQELYVPNVIYNGHNIYYVPLAWIGGKVMPIGHYKYLRDKGMKVIRRNDNLMIIPL